MEGHSGHSPEEIKKHVRIYIAVFIALALLTVATVWVSYLHLALIPAIAVALAIATFKGSLVASFFMHLSTEKKVIFAILLLTVIFASGLLIIPALR